jgi:hypothetical protein
MLVRGLLVAGLLILAAVVVGLRRSPESSPQTSPQEVKPWSLTADAAGTTFSWDRSAPELRNAARVDLILHNGVMPSTYALDRRNGTLIIPYSPRTVILSVDGRRIPLFGSEREPAQAPPEPPQSSRERKAAPTQRTLELPMVLSNRGRRVVSTAAVILPRVPGYVQRPLDIDVFVKVAPQGKVASVAADYRHDPLRNRLSAVASDAISRWQFDRIAVNSYREGRIRVVFTPQGVSVQPAPVG